MSNNIVKLQKLCKSYNSIFSLKNISFSLKAGEIITVIGSNGSGKTTLAKLVTGVIPPDAGNIIYFVKSKDKRFIGYAPENPILWQSLTIIEQIEIVLSMYRLKSKSWDYHLFKKLQLEKIKNIPVYKLSNGNKKKLNFFLSIIHKPSLLVLDEPFNSLDSINTETVIRWLIEYIKQERRGVFITTNRPDIVNTFNKKVLILEDGNAIYKRGFYD